MAKPFQARMIRISGPGLQLIQHSADWLSAARCTQRCRQDQHDHISIDFLAAAGRTSVTHNGTRRLNTGDMVVMDLSQPVVLQRARHSVISLFIPRERLRATCGDPAFLADRLLKRTGLPALLRGHMQTTIDQAANLAPAARVLALQIAMDMALLILQDEAQGHGNADVLAGGLYLPAKACIEEQCGNPELSPLSLSMALGCSRAALYRAFAQHGESVAAAIWAARIERARLLLISAAHFSLSVGEIAFRCGFSDQSTFNRMFRRVHDMTPCDMRGISQE